MVIPRVNLSCHYITSELEEIEREDNFRLKRFKELKIKKQKVKEKKMIKTIPEESESTTCSCKSSTVTPEKDKISVRSTYRDKINITVPKIAKPDSQTVSLRSSKTKLIELVDQGELNRKDSNRSNKCCQVDSNISTPKPKYKESKAEMICPTCNTHVKVSSKDFSSSCTGTIPGVDTSTEPDISPISQNQEADTKSAASICSCSQLAKVQLPSDKDIKLVSSDKSCTTTDTKESKLKEEEKKYSCESICKGDERKPEKEDKDNENFIESVKEIKIRKLKDKDGNVRVEKRIVTTTYENKIPISKCCSESNMYKKPSYAGSNRTVKISKSKLKGKRNQPCVKPCGSASTEVPKAPPSATLCCDTDKDDQEVQNKSNNSTSQSASVNSVDYSCSDKTVSACNSCSESKASEETKTTQTCHQKPNDTKTENEKPKPSYCTVKIFTKAATDVPKDEGCNSIELTPSMFDLLKKILEQAKNLAVCSDVAKRPINTACDCGTTMASGILKQKSICSTNKADKVTEVENTQGCSCQKKPEQNIQVKEETPINEGVQFTPSSETGSVEIADSDKKDVATETIIGSIRKIRSVQKHSCESKVNESKNSIIGKQNSSCSCKSKKSNKDNSMKCPCSKSQNEPPEKTSCTCSKVASEEKKCKCSSKEEITKPLTSSAPKLAGICKPPKPDLLELSKCCDKPETPATVIKPTESNDSKISKCVSISEPENTDYPETKDVCTQKASFDSCCSQKKTPKSDKPTASKCSLCGKKDASTSTRRSDRYDVRPLRLLNLPIHMPCPSLSDSVIVKNKRSKNTRVRRCSSYNASPHC